MSHRTDFQLRELKNAIINNKLDKVADMMEKGFSPNTILHEPSRKRGIHIAAKAGNNDMVKLLIDFGAKPYNIKTYPDKQDPLHVASSWGHVDVVRLLIEHGAWTNLKNAAGNTAIHLAAMGDHGDVIQELLKKNRCKVDIRQSAGRTALHLAVSMQHKNATKALVAGGANPLVKDPKRKFAALEMAMHRNDPETFGLIVENMDKSKLDLPDTLFKAICYHRVGDDFVAEMSRLGFDINAKDANNKCLLERALHENFHRPDYGYYVDASWCVYRLLYLGAAPLHAKLCHDSYTDSLYTEDVINYIELETVEGVKVLKYLLQYGYDVTAPRLGYRRFSKNRPYVSTNQCFENVFQLCYHLSAYDAALVTVDAGVDISPRCEGLRDPPSNDTEANFLTELKQRVRNPRSLQSICRNSITRRIRDYPKALSKIVEPLGLPSLIRDYLTFRYM